MGDLTKTQQKALDILLNARDQEIERTREQTCYDFMDGQYTKMMPHICFKDIQGRTLIATLKLIGTDPLDGKEYDLIKDIDDIKDQYIAPECRVEHHALKEETEALRKMLLGDKK